MSAVERAAAVLDEHWFKARRDPITKDLVAGCGGCFWMGTRRVGERGGLEHDVHQAEQLDAAGLLRDGSPGMTREQMQAALARRTQPCWDWDHERCDVEAPDGRACDCPCHPWARPSDPEPTTEETP